MKIFSNFDTKIKSKSLDEYAAVYGRENILCFGRSRLYWTIKVFLPVILLIALCLGILSFFYYILDGEYMNYVLIIVIVLSLFFFLPLIGKWIDYKLDFIIITPDFLVMYDQAGIFNKKIITLNEKSIKTISIERKGLLYSLFNNGDIVFLAEGDVTEHGDVKLKWIPKPEKRRDQIATIMNKE